MRVRLWPAADLSDYLFSLPGGARATTTPGPCLGGCGWDWNPATKLWERTDSTCDPGCACLAPTFCPDESMECATTRTNCGRIDDDQPSPNCTGTTTTPSPSCTEGCVWRCIVGKGWTKEVGNCRLGCPCPRPASPCDSTCSEVTTQCTYSPPPPPSGCGGSCLWAWVTPGDYWENVTEVSGFPSCDNIICACALPPALGPPGLDPCGKTFTTACYPLAPRDPCSDSVTTTPGPGCTGSCLWRTSDGSTFDTIIRGCPDCACETPIRDPQDECDTVETPCVAATTTTTTTTQPCGICFWSCNCVGSGGGGGGGGGGQCVCINYRDRRNNRVTFICATVETAPAILDGLRNNPFVSELHTGLTNPCTTICPICGGLPEPPTTGDLAAYQWQFTNGCGYYGNGCNCPQSGPPNDCPAGCSGCSEGGPVSCGGPCVAGVSPPRAYCEFGCDPTTTTTTAAPSCQSPCKWVCADGSWSISTDCPAEGCTCAPPDLACTPALDAFLFTSSCTGAGTTTTTSTTTTTASPAPTACTSQPVPAHLTLTLGGALGAIGVVSLTYNSGLSLWQGTFGACGGGTASFYCDGGFGWNLDLGPIGTIFGGLQSSETPFTWAGSGTAAGTCSGGYTANVSA